jgi:hypothetical protein
VAKDDGVRPSGLQEPHDALSNSHLLVPREQMEEVLRAHQRDLVLELLELLIVIVQHVAGYESRLGPVAVAEQLVAELEELGMQVGSVQLGRVDTLVSELADRLADEAAQVEECVFRAWSFETLNGLLRYWALEVLEPEPGKASDAGISGDCPSFVPLSAGNR